MNCPECGFTGYREHLPCEDCNYSQTQPLHIVSLADPTRSVGPCRVGLAVNRGVITRVQPDNAKYWDAVCQFRVEPVDSEWRLRPNPAAKNQTLVDGASVTTEVVLVDGMQVSVGNESRGTNAGWLEIQLG